MDKLFQIEKELLGSLKKDIPDFSVGDRVKVT